MSEIDVKEAVNVDNIWFKSVIEEKCIEFLSNLKVIVIYIELILKKLIAWELTIKFSFKIKSFGVINSV